MIVAIVASLHSKENTGIGAIEVIIVQVLHHQKGSPVVLMSRHHDLLVKVHGGLVLERMGE